jgi:hypothetical protein
MTGMIGIKKDERIRVMRGMRQMGGMFRLRGIK